MDIVDSCKRKLEYFRIRELKDVLTCAGVSKQGKKQDLLDKILALLYDEGTPSIFKHINGKEELVAIIDDTYRKMVEEGVIIPISRKQNNASRRSQKLKESLPIEALCLCGCSIFTKDEPIQCSYGNCNTWRHGNCVYLPEQLEAEELTDKRFLCEICRINQADPFWRTISYVLDPVKMAFANVTLDGSKPLQSVEKDFYLTRANQDLIAKTEYDLQAWCVLLTDCVPLRIHWPQHAELLVNGILVRPYSRPGSQKLGANGRDDGASITLYVVEGVNKISLSGYDDRNFCLGVRLVKRQAVREVLSMIPEESVGESFEDAVARVQRCIGGGPIVGDEDGESDLEVVTDLITFSLRCPMSGGRMKIAGRFKPCVHMGCFDLETFVQLNERSRKWQCPICLKNYSLENLIIDPYFNRIVSMMQHCGQEISEIELKLDGSWRVKNAHSIGNLAMWHYSDSSLMLDARSSKLTMHENGFGGDNAPKLGLQNFEVDITSGKPQCLSHCESQPKDFDLEVIAMSSTTCGDAEDDVATSINQCYDEPVGNSSNGEIEVNSAPHDGEGHSSVDRNCSVLAREPEIIVLSDSEEDEVALLSSPQATSAAPLYYYNGLPSSSLQETSHKVEQFVSGEMLPSQNGSHNGNEAPLGTGKNEHESSNGHVKAHPNRRELRHQCRPIEAPVRSNIIAGAWSDQDISRKRSGEGCLVPRQPRSVIKRQAKTNILPLPCLRNH